eukprot:825168-Pyramimonas_sp.AAC.1
MHNVGHMPCPTPLYKTPNPTRSPRVCMSARYSSSSNPRTYCYPIQAINHQPGEAARTLRVDR